MGLIVTPIATGVALFIASQIVAGFKIKGFRAALKLGLVLTLLNWVLRPLIEFFAFPFMVLTLGLARIVVNGLILDFSTDLIGDVESDSFLTSVKTSLTVSVLLTVAELLLSR